MRAGVIGLPDFEFEPVESFSDTKKISEDTTLTACLEVRRTDTTSGVTFQTGRAALQELGSEEQVRIDQSDNSISVSENANTVKTKYTEFVLVPNEFVAVSNGGGTFAFEMIAGQTDAARISRAKINLDDLVRSYEDDKRPESAKTWQVGFYGNSGEAEKGTVYGDGIFSDRELGDVVAKLPKNQIGLIIKSDGEEDINMTATESGYVEVYQPSSYDAAEYADFILNHIIQHAEQRS
ncbi:hypothetical protein [Haloarchaeobius litoreus]|uniref:DUF4340 domain-containing protein n=1 Tax=Haloarchaeobius litoreus TaxID=755306 RepID=A0ABD6DGW9_9EURY|nr:hypothetical protein [Haloarchaeobius litoreus]